MDSLSHYSSSEAQGHMFSQILLDFPRHFACAGGVGQVDIDTPWQTFEG